VYPAPDATEPSQVLPAINELGSPLVLLTVTWMDDWYQVLLPTRPNGSTAWVPAGAVNVAVPQFRAELDRSAMELRVVSIADGAVVLTSPTGIGAPSTPTPSGLFFVRDHFPTSGAGHPYGPFAFGLSGHSDVYLQFGTGDGRIAIHGTNQPSSIGAAASNGCPHVPNDVVLALIPYLPLGTPVLIT
jgi:lipoprotein-anchoring transpeptidase ErfK/SrfK